MGLESIVMPMDLIMRVNGRTINRMERDLRNG